MLKNRRAGVLVSHRTLSSRQVTRDPGQQSSLGLVYRFDPCVNMQEIFPSTPLEQRLPTYSRVASQPAPLCSAACSSRGSAQNTVVRERVLFCRCLAHQYVPIDRHHALAVWMQARCHLPSIAWLVFVFRRQATLRTCQTKEYEGRLVGRCDLPRVVLYDFIKLAMTFHFFCASHKAWIISLLMLEKDRRFRLSFCLSTWLKAS